MLKLYVNETINMKENASDNNRTLDMEHFAQMFYQHVHFHKTNIQIIQRKRYKRYKEIQDSKSNQNIYFQNITHE